MVGVLIERLTSAANGKAGVEISMEEEESERWRGE